MTKRILLVLAVLSMLFGLVSTVASATGDGWSPDGVWETDDGAEWVRFYERRGQKQAQWHADSFGPCRGGPATSSSANWWFDNGGVHVKVWATCDTAQIRLRPFELWFAQEPDWDLFETNTETTWVNYLLHPAAPDIPPGCYIDSGINPDFLYSGVPDTANNIDFVFSFDGSCSGSPGFLGSGWALVIAATQAEAITKCAAINGIANAGGLPFYSTTQPHYGYPGFPEDAAWLCSGTS